MTPKQLNLPFEMTLATLTPDDIYDNASEALLEELREDRRIERKSARIHPKDLGDYFSMWANTPPGGGIVIVGIEKNGTVTGCNSLSNDQVSGLEKTPFTYCPDAKYDSKRIDVTNEKGENDWILTFRVYYRDDILVRTVSGDSFTRVGSTKKLISPDEAYEIQIDKQELDLEQQPVDFNYPDDFNRQLINQFCNNYRNRRGLDPAHPNEEILEQRHLGKQIGEKFQPNVACALLFAKDPRSRFPGCRIRFLRYEGEVERTGKDYNVVKDLFLEGCVPGLISEAEKAVEAQLREFSRLGPDGLFYTAPEYPKAAWYEAIVNAVCHRSYGLRNMNVFIKMFDDRLVIESPGPFPPLVTPENIYDTTHPRNPYMMDALFYLDFVKMANEGSRRIRDSMREMNLPEPKFAQKEVGNAIVRVTLRNNTSARREWVDADMTAGIDKEVVEGLSPNERRALNFVTENGDINVSQVMRLTDRSWKTAKKLLDGLAEKGLLQHIKREHLDRDPQARYVLTKGIRR